MAWGERPGSRGLEKLGQPVGTSVRVEAEHRRQVWVVGELDPLRLLHRALGGQAGGRQMLALGIVAVGGDVATARGSGPFAERFPDFFRGNESSSIRPDQDAAGV